MLFCWKISICFAGICFCSGLTPSTYLTASDNARLKVVFSSALPLKDVVTAHYVLLGYSLLGENITKMDDACKLAVSSMDSKNLELIFHGSSITTFLADCKLNSANLQYYLESAIISDESSLQDIYHAVLSLKNFGFNIDSGRVAKALISALKKDDSVLNLGLAFHIASVLQGDLTPFFERIEDVIVQADEVDGKYLQFEGGLGITSITISGVYRLAEVIKKAPAITPDQAVKFTNYFLSRKFVQAVKGAAQLLHILKILTTNKFHLPVSVTLASNSALSPQNPFVQIRMTNVLGETLGPLTVIADSAVRHVDDVMIWNKKSLQSVKESDVLYSLNFMESKPLGGFYKLLISASPNKTDSRLVGNMGAEIFVKVMTEVDVENAEIGTVDRDQATFARSFNIVFPKLLDRKLEADYHQKVLMKFSLRDKNAKTTMTAHQTFVQLLNKQRKEEITFVAELDSSNVYRFDLDVYSKAKEFNYASGMYEISLVVGDAVIINPFTWKIGQIFLTFPTNPNPQKFVEDPFAPKPDIKHLFREQEKRPSSLMSNTFSVLVMIPLFLLFIIWIQLGANLSNFPCSFSAVLFHFGLCGIFCLFVVFWLHLNMFTTLKCLSGLGLITFLSGHRLLNQLATVKK